MLGFKSFWTARVALGGIELVHMLRKGQLAVATGQTLLSPAEAFYRLAAWPPTRATQGRSYPVRGNATKPAHATGAFL